MKIQILMITAACMTFAGFAEAAPKRQQRRAAEPTYERQARASSVAGQNQAGCGLGSLAIQDNSKWAQVGASLLNGTGMQSFAITFGTSNCTEDGVASASREKDAFVEANISDIRRDLSVGGGDYLSSLASLYGCKGENEQSFNRALRKHQESVQSSSTELAGAAIDAAVSAEQVSCQG